MEVRGQVGLGWNVGGKLCLVARRGACFSKIFRLSSVGTAEAVPGTWDWPDKTGLLLVGVPLQSHEIRGRTDIKSPEYRASSIEPRGSQDNKSNQTPSYCSSRW